MCREHQTRNIGYQCDNHQLAGALRQLERLRCNGQLRRLPAVEAAALLWLMHLPLSQTQQRKVADSLSRRIDFYDKTQHHQKSDTSWQKNNSRLQK